MLSEQWLMGSLHQSQWHPLYVIFEQHLYNFQDSEMDRKTFVEAVLKDYLAYLRKNNIWIPKSLEVSIHEELSSQIQVMLVKKIYGCLNIQEYAQRQPRSVKRRARTRYSRLSVLPSDKRTRKRL